MGSCAWMLFECNVVRMYSLLEQYNNDKKIFVKNLKAPIIFIWHEKWLQSVKQIKQFFHKQILKDKMCKMVPRGIAKIRFGISVH